MTTPENITELKPNQIFVFGSNLNGNHDGGAAAFAKEKFGAVDGVGEGPTGQSYAFPTLDKKMNKVSLKVLEDSKKKLYEYATNNPDKQFLVTKLGCGIAGFKEKDMKKIFKGAKPSNVILPQGWAVIRGYKAFEEGLKCKGVQYEFGKEHHFDGEIKLCASGFHFCKSLGDVYGYYPFGAEICEIETEGIVIDEEEGTKSVTNHLRLVRKLNPIETKGNKNDTSTGYLNTGDWNTGNRNTGDRNTGHRNTGHWNTGHWNTGDRNTGHLNTGNRNTGHLNTGHLNTGNRNTGDWNTGNLNTGHLNTETPDYILVFNEKCSIEKWNDAYKPSWMYFNLTEWIDFYDMTAEEKENYPSCKTTGGYLKKLDYKEAFKRSYESASQSEKDAIKKLPNFNRKVFFEISGIEIK